MISFIQMYTVISLALNFLEKTCRIRGVYRPPCRTQVLAGQQLLREARRMPSPCHPAPEVYAQRWGRLVELEAAASAVEGNDSRLLFDVPITWGEKDGARRLRGVWRGDQKIFWTFKENWDFTFWDFKVWEVSLCSYLHWVFFFDLQDTGDTFCLTPSGSKDAAGRLAGVLYHLSQPCEESPGFVEIPLSKSTNLYLYMSHVLNPCVHVKKGAPCKDVRHLEHGSYRECIVWEHLLGGIMWLRPNLFQCSMYGIFTNLCPQHHPVM